MVRCWGFETVVGILVKASFWGVASPISVLNCYGPYRNREIFWDNILSGGLLSIPNLILGGDLNLTLSASETWGSKAILDPLASHFRLMFDSVYLVDVAQPDSGPTWRNGRVGEAGISKRLDRFLISSSLLPAFNLHCV